MESKKIIIVLIIICLILIGVLCFVMSSSSQNDVSNNVTNNTTNMTSNITNNTTNETVDSTESSNNADYSSYSKSSSSNDEPEYGSDDYVDRWDQSNIDGDSWAYTHDQPVKTDKNGNEYKRMYDEDTGENYWYKMN